MRLVIAILAAVLLAGTAVAQQAPKREITQIAGDLYRFQNNFHYSVFLVTPDGIVATDPINADAAAWLKAELARRFDVPVRYLVYSHDHADHISGGEVFADSATVIAHENAAAHIAAEDRPTARPAITFAERMTIALGGKTVELVYLGKNHSDGSIVMHFPAERAVFAVDFVSVNRLPYRNLPNAWIDEWIESLKRLEAMEFDIIAPGHGGLGNKADVAAHRRYIEELRAEVLSRLRQGQDVEQIKAEVTMPAYAEWGSYKDWIGLNVEGMAQHMQNFRRGN